MEILQGAEAAAAALEAAGALEKVRSSDDALNGAGSKRPATSRRPSAEAGQILHELGGGLAAVEHVEEQPRSSRTSASTTGGMSSVATSEEALSASPQPGRAKEQRRRRWSLWGGRGTGSPPVPEEPLSPGSLAASSLGSTSHSLRTTNGGGDSSRPNSGRASQYNQRLARARRHNSMVAVRRRSTVTGVGDAPRRGSMALKQGYRCGGGGPTRRRRAGAARRGGEAGVGAGRGSS